MTTEYPIFRYKLGEYKSFKKDNFKFFRKYCTKLFLFNTQFFFACLKTNFNRHSGQSLKWKHAVPHKVHWQIDKKLAILLFK